MTPTADPRAADGDAAGPGCRPRPGRRARRLPPAGAAAPHRHPHRPGEQVLVPCGHTLASVCPPCAERARVLRAAQCREGWHLDHEPVIDPDDPRRLAAQAGREARRDPGRAGPRRRPRARHGRAGRADRRAGRGDHRAGHARERPARPGHAASPLYPAAAGRRRICPGARSRPDGRQDLHRPGRQDVPAVDVRHADLPGLRQGHADGTPADPDRYDYGRAARDALHFAALFDRFIQNLRRFLGYDVQYFAAVEPQRRLAPHVHIAMRGTVSRAELRQVSPPPTTRSGGRTPPPSATTATSCRSGTRPAATTSIPRPARSCPPGMTRWTRSATEDEPLHVARFGDRFDAQGVLAGSKDAARCIGYLTKYLTKHVADCHQASHRRPARRTPNGWPTRCGTSRAHRTCANWLRYGIQPKNARAGLRPGRVQGQGPPPRIPRLRRPPRPGLAQVVGQDPGRPPRRPQGLAHWKRSAFRQPTRPATPGNRSPPATPTTCPPPSGCCTSSPTGSRWQAALAEARRRAAATRPPIFRQPGGRRDGGPPRRQRPAADRGGGGRAA